MPRVQRTGRDWAADLGFVLFAACFAALTSQTVTVMDDPGPVWRVVDQVAGGLGCAALLARRRWPVPLAVVLVAAGTATPYLTGPVLVAVFTVAATQQRRVTAGVAALVFAPLPLFLWRLADLPEARADRAVTYFALVAGAVGWGLFRRSRGQLIASLRARAELAEADAELRADRARQEIRAQIAREMHDVLGHRLSLLSVHAGALEFNTSASAAQVAEAAGVIRENAHLALRDLREVIGVLNDGGPGDELWPSVGLADLGRLVAETRAAGAAVELTGWAGGLVEGVAPPAAVGRAALRIVQEALTNARMHAPGAPVAVRLSGGPGRGLTVDVHSGPVPSSPGSSAEADPPTTVPRPAAGWAGGGATGGGRGLVGLAERARVAGGVLRAGPTVDGFEVRAWLPWAAEPAEDQKPDQKPDRERERGGGVDDRCPAGG
ncbi:two-component sensor histidine kinase [Frankia sp. CcI49]|uniref:sensor histidine kinase n=1 Tax=Frankia sp. CcI49 TaxID=1745382 RepID=UPI000975883D|nr:histidine kinase [Frankia sp. CcI49]ONH59239.1 two-component sensor histidine kinase [Frankia sp. CcI49]